MIGNVEPGTPEGHRYELLTALVEAYEAEKYPIEHSDDPIAMIEFVLEARGLTLKDPRALHRDKTARVGYYGETPATNLGHDSSAGAWTEDPR